MRSEPFTTVSRRSAIASTLAALTFASAARPSPFLGGHRAEIGINLYMVAGPLARDADGTLDKLAEIGFRDVEADLSILDPAAFRARLDRHGLRCTNLGILPTPLRGGLSLADDPGRIADAARVMGATHVTCTLFPLPNGIQMRPQPGETIDAMLARVTGAMTEDDWKRAAAFLNGKGDAFRRHGLQFGYHNHNAEFRPIRDTNGMAILLKNTDPSLVDFEMDAGWVVAAGHDPVELLGSHPGRFRYMHVKDVSSDSPINTVMRIITKPVGDGVIDWPKILRAASRAGVRHFSIEQEPPYLLEPLESARRSFVYLTALRPG